MHTYEFKVLLSPLPPTPLLSLSLSLSLSLFPSLPLQGALVEAVRCGHWILLDEINLATPETLQCLSSLLESPHDSFIIPEKP